MRSRREDVSCSFHLHFCNPEQGEEISDSSLPRWIQQHKQRAKAGQGLWWKRQKTPSWSTRTRSAGLFEFYQKENIAMRNMSWFSLVQPKVARLWWWKQRLPSSACLGQCSCWVALPGWINAPALPIKNVLQECKALIKLFPRWDFQTPFSLSFI